MTPPMASEPHSADCGSADHLDSRRQIGVQDFISGRVAGGGVVDLDAVDEQQAVIGFGAANPDFGQRAAWPEVATAADGVSRISAATSGSSRRSIRCWSMIVTLAGVRPRSPARARR